MRARHFSFSILQQKKKTLECHKAVSTEKAQYTEIPLLWDKELLQFGSTCTKSAHGSVRSAVRGNMVSTFRDKAMNASHGTCAQSIPGLKHKCETNLKNV
jgi:hypothetical protein